MIISIPYGTVCPHCSRRPAQIGMVGFYRTPIRQHRGDRHKMVYEPTDYSLGVGSILESHLEGHIRLYCDQGHSFTICPSGTYQYETNRHELASVCRTCGAAGTKRGLDVDGPQLTVRYRCGCGSEWTVWAILNYDHVEYQR